MLVDVTSFSPLPYMLGIDVTVGVIVVVTDNVTAGGAIGAAIAAAVADGFLGDSGGVTSPIPTSSFDLFSNELW